MGNSRIRAAVGAVYRRARAVVPSGAVVVTYATWNPTDKGSNVTLSNGNLTATEGAVANQDFVRSTVSKSSGKWYWEITANSTNTLHGITTSGALFSAVNFVFSAANTGWGYYGQNGNKYTNSTPTAYGSAFTTNDVIGVALDLDNGKIWFAKNGTWQASGDPAAGTNAAFTGLSGTFFATTGSDGTNAAQATANFGATAFAFTPPSGFNSGLYS